MNAERRNIKNIFKMKHVQIPKVFFTNDKYMNMKNDTKIAWSILSDRSNLSLKNNWIDEKGDIYFIFSNKELKKILNCSEPKVISIKNELLEHGLLDQERVGMNKPNKLYIKDPIVTDDDIYKIQEQEEGLDIYPEQKQDSNPDETRNLKNLSTGTKKTLAPELKKFKPSNTELINPEFNNTELNIVNKKQVNNSNLEYDNQSSEDQSKVYEIEKQYMKKGLSKEVIQRVKEEVDSNRVKIDNYIAYYRSCLDNTLYKHNLKHGKIEGKKYNHLPSTHPLNMNWLQE
ncbi:Replication initiator protein A (RepA) N-terminus [Marinococcus luteus]|uniref:Replication initiator protein A (RepA) N-terminus n=1 Tax=Marinococcus luteus TaxID=1122204 RepID=A0A1H2YBH3_9BACI|nr:replication initiator protein A [Marinococcus luteus]SDX01899.1 Replication initiator protein A (RepA) N-terminus [Marinococcus luteus]